MIFRHPMLVVSTLALACAFVACDPKPEAGGAATATATTKPTATATAKPKGPPLLNPKAANEEAPAKYKAKFVTTKGDFVIEVTRDWAPRGADRLYNLIKIGFYKDMALHRVVEDLVVQFGIHGDPEVSGIWRKAYMMDEKVKESNKEWMVTFAKRDTDTRTTEVFINLKDNSEEFDKKGFSPFGKVVEGQDVIKKLYAGYGEKVMARGGQTEIYKLGNDWLKSKWPELDYIKSASVE